MLIFWGIAWASAAHGERSIRNSQHRATPAGMRSTATATAAAAAIIQPHRAHASTWCAYIDTHQRHPHAQAYLEQTAPPIRASLMCVLLPSPLHLSWGQPGPRRTWRVLWDAARVLIFWGIAWAVLLMERGRSVTVLCNTCRNAFHRHRHRPRHHPAAPRPRQYMVRIHRHTSETPARSSVLGTNSATNSSIIDVRVAALSTPFILGAAWAATHMERALGRSPCVDILGDSLGRAAHGERSIHNSAVQHLQECVQPLPPPPSSSRTAPTPVHGTHT